MSLYIRGIIKSILSLSAVIFCFSILLPLNTLATMPVETHTAEEYKPLARRLFERITGVKIASADERVSKMAGLLAKGKPNSAINIALKDPAFTNVRARNFALQLSNKANSLNVNLDDMSALITGIIRDDIDFREILTADYHYELSNGHSYKNNYHMLLENAFSEAEGLYLSRDYYSVSDRRLPDLFLGLEKVPGIFVPISYNTGKLNKIYAVPGSKIGQIDESVVQTERHPDPAGVFTTRGFASSQYSGGTNRRPVEFVVRNFLCSSMGEIANNMASDAYVGKDVSRFPGGNHQTYLQSCKSCHTVMDSFRGAFAKTDYKQLSGQFAESAALFHGDFGVKYYTLALDWRNTYLQLKPQLDEQAAAKIGDQTQLLTAVQKMSELDYSLYTPTSPAGAPSSFAERVAWEKYLLQHKLFLPQAIKKVKSDYLNTLPITSTCTKNSTIAALINKLTDPATQNSGTFTEKLSDYSTTPAATADAKTVCLNGLYNQMMNYVNTQTDASWTAWKKESLKQVYLNNKIVFDLTLKKAKTAYDTQFEIDYFTPLTMIITASNTRWSIAKKAYDAEPPANTANKAALLQAMNLEKEYFLQFADFVNQSKINPMSGTNFAAESAKKPVVSPQVTLKQSYLNIRPAISNFVFTSEFLIPEAISELKIIDTSLSSFDFIADYKANNLTSKVALHLIAKFQANGASAELIIALKDFILNKTNELLESDRFFVRTERRNYLENLDQWIVNITPGVSQKTGVVDKMNNGSYPEGFEVVDDSFVNLSSEKYGWRGSYKSGGKGLGQFGQMISQSTAFSSCMAKKIFKEVCYQNISDPNEIKKWQGRFESLGYKVKALIGEIVQSPSCGLVESGGQ